MRLPLSQTLSAALRQADDQARVHGQEFVGTEHLLLGMLAEPTSQASRALESATNLPELQQEVKAGLPGGADVPLVTGRLPLSPKAQRALNTAMSDAQAAHETNVSSRWLLAALLSDGASGVRESLSRSGADLDDLCRQLRRPSATIEP